MDDDILLQVGATDAWIYQSFTRLSPQIIQEPPLNAAHVQPQDLVVIDFVGRVADTPHQTDGPIFQQARQWLIVIGEKDVLPALELGIRFLQVGATAHIWSASKYAHGPGQRKYDPESAKELNQRSYLPPQTNVLYQVTVHRVIEDTSNVDVQFRLCQSRKEIGNDIYRNECIQRDAYAKSRALQLYGRAAETLEYLWQQQQQQPDNSTATKVHDALIDCLNNIAAVHLSCKAYHEAKEACIQVLARDPHNSKALVRAAKAAMEDPASTYEEVEAAIAAAEQSGSETKQLQAELRRRKQVHRRKSKQMYSSMAKGMVKGEQNTGRKSVEQSVDQQTPMLPKFNGKQMESLFSGGAPFVVIPMIIIAASLLAMGWYYDVASIAKNDL